MNEDTALIIKQNEVLISLLGRMAFGNKRVREIVTSRKKTPERYIKGYNACDGNHTVTEIASIVGVKQATLSPILRDWEDEGIIFEVRRPKGKFYKGLFKLGRVD
jgi:DNA-binding MarR family transcriptional regulator